MNASFLLLYFTELKMPGISLEEIQAEFADLDIDITDGDILSKLKVKYNPRGKNMSVLSTLILSIIYLPKICNLQWFGLVLWISYEKFMIIT